MSRASRTCCRRVPDITKLRELIGYEPTLDLPEILQKVIDFYSDNA